MNKEKMEEMDALMGSGKNTNAGGATDKSSISQEVFDKTNHELDVARGRLKTLDARNKELEKEVATLRASKARTDIVSTALSDEERANLDPTFLDAAAKIAAASADAVRQDYEERERARQEQEAANRAANEAVARENFARKIEERYPGFFNSVSRGGPYHEQWLNFKNDPYLGSSIVTAWNDCNVEVMSMFIEKFNSSLSIRVPSGSQGQATSPEPRNLGSGATVVHHGGPNKVYTADEYSALEKQADQLRRRGDWDGYRKVCDELNNILAEGRVKD